MAGALRGCAWSGGAGVAGFHSRRVAVSAPTRPTRRVVVAVARGGGAPPADGGSGGAGEDVASAAASAAAVAGGKRRRPKMGVLGLFFVVVTFAWSVLFFVPMVLMHPAVLAFDRVRRRAHDLVALAWLRISLATVGLTPRVVHAERLLGMDTPVMYVTNHASNLDVYAIAFLRRRFKYVSKAEIFRVPIIGWAMALTGNLSLKRTDRKSAMATFRGMVRLMNAGTSMVVFPEGTRSTTGRLGRFRLGAFKAARAAGVPVVPVTIRGTREVMPYDAIVPLRYPAQQISLTVHPPIPTDGPEDDMQVMQTAFELINSALPDGERAVLRPT
ncbi:hypothetical protein MMPV_006830 [Pyropia vietnamensis]